MTREEILDRFRNLNVWRRGGERAPHKPLLVLMALARVRRGDGGSLRYREVDEQLRRLLDDFGPPRKTQHPEYPFWRLQRDGVWIVRDCEPLATRKSNNDPLKSELMRVDPSAGWTPEIALRLSDDPTLVSEVARVVLDSSFPESLHGEILGAVGLDLATATAARRPRNPAFRTRVLRAYEHRCAICDFDLRLGTSDLALDAAHIMWHQAGGPDEETNGLALCVLHHRLFDRGAFTVGPNMNVLVSQEVHGSAGIREALLDHHDREIRPPQSESYRPELRYLRWHAREVFRAPARCA